MTRSEPTGRDRLLAALRPRATRTQAIVGLLCMLLGFGLALQVRSNRGDAKFETARPDELVSVLDNLSQRSDRLRAEIQGLRETRARTESGSRRREAILADARKRADTLGVLAGTLPATGPGIELTISDPGGKVDASMLLDALEELRDAGAEAVQVGEVRVVASTYLIDAPGGGVNVDGTLLRQPYRFLVIGDPRTMAAALDIPGGVIESLRGVGAQGDISQRDKVEISALRESTTSRYARPASGRGDAGR